jgi:hypothetical protein
MDSFFSASHTETFLQEGKKKFDKETTKFCMSLERHLNLSTKKSENSLQEVSGNFNSFLISSQVFGVQVSVPSDCFTQFLKLLMPHARMHMSGTGLGVL